MASHTFAIWFWCGVVLFILALPVWLGSHLIASGLAVTGVFMAAIALLQTERDRRRSMEVATKKKLFNAGHEEG